MKYVKTLGLAAVAVMALMAFLEAGSASATVLTSPKGVQYEGEIVGSLEESVFETGSANLACFEGSIKGKVAKPGSETETATVAVEEWSFLPGSCTLCPAEINSGRTLELHAIAGTANGTVTSEGVTTTLSCGFKGCTYSMTGSHVGTFTGSGIMAGTATLDIEITLKNEPSLCFFPEGRLRATYLITTPDYLDVD